MLLEKDKGKSEERVWMVIKHIYKEQSFYRNKVLLDKVGRIRRKTVGKVETKRKLKEEREREEENEREICEGEKLRW